MPWAGRLFDTLCRHVDRKQGFMDINGGIPRGANFETVLNEAEQARALARRERRLRIIATVAFGAVGLEVL